FIGTLQVCTPMFDVNLILHTYGLFGIFIEITVIEIANAFFLRDAIAHPCPLVTTASRKRLALRTAFLVFGVQLTAAYLSYFFARAFWKLRLHPMHDNLLVALTAGSLIEGLATFSSKAVEFFASEWYANSKAQTLLNCTFAGFLTTLGVTHLGHLIVYWLSPLVGWFLADAVFGEQECALIECFTEEAEAQEEEDSSNLIKMKSS
ncbi:unnamed protein product, partial [Litomosoides sigmodontis]